MDVAEIRELARIVIALAGALSIYWGYKLFCKIQRIDVVSGALLAIFGMGLLTADARAIDRPAAVPRAPLHHTKPVGTGRHKPSTDWLA